MIQLASALKLLHARGIAHKDLKPQNVLFFSNAFGQVQVKLTDFGTSLNLKNDMTVTRLGKFFMGTPGYTSPEFDKFIELDQS